VLKKAKATKRTRTSTIKVETSTTYEILYGGRKLSDRNTRITNKEDFAQTFFKEKEQEGLYVDVFKVVRETTTTRTKLTKKE
jgi:hypothetical protein